MRIDQDWQREHQQDIIGITCAFIEQEHQIVPVSCRIRFRDLGIDRSHEVRHERIHGRTDLKGDSSRRIDRGTKEQVHHNVATLIPKQARGGTDEIPSGKAEHLSQQALIIAETIRALLKLSLAIVTIQYAYH